MLATAFLESCSPTCNSFSSNVRNEETVEHPIQGKEATSQLLTLCQGSQSVATHTIEFRILAAESGWNKIALLGVIIHGLSEEIKDKLAARDEMDSLKDLISFCLDKLLRERR